MSRLGGQLERERVGRNARTIIKELGEQEQRSVR